MAGKAKNKVENELGCGFMGSIFNLRSFRLRKSSVHSLPMKPSNNVQSDQRKSESTESQKPPRKSTTNTNKQNRRPSDAARSSTSSSRNSTQTKIQQNQNLNDESKIQRENENKPPLRLTGNLLVNSSPRISIKSTENVSKSKDSNFMLNSHSHNNSTGIRVMGNIMRRNSDELAQFRSPRNRVDPEVLKRMGNEAYKQGRFEEALVLYERAISIDSHKATYRCNKSAALMGLGRLLEAIVECQEAIRLDPSYNRPHQRLAAIYLR